MVVEGKPKRLFKSTGKGRRGGLREPRGGRPKKERLPTTPEIIELCAASGKTLEQTARLAGLDVNTLLRNYRENWENGKHNVDLKVTRKIIAAATDPKHTSATVTAALHYAETRMGWKKPDRAEVQVNVNANAIAGGSAEVSAREFIESRLVAIRERLNLPKPN